MGVTLATLAARRAHPDGGRVRSLTAIVYPRVTSNEGEGPVFAWWGRAVVRARWFVLAATLAVVAVGAVWGTGIFGALASGGFDDPASESSRAHALIEERFGSTGDDLTILYTHPTATADQPALAGPVQAVLDRLEGRPEVVAIGSLYDGEHPTYVSTDGHSTYITLRLRDNDEDGKLADLRALEPLLEAGGEVDTEVGGIYAFLRDANEQVEADIVRAELISAPVLFVLLLVIFRGLVAAVSPLLVGGVAILGGFVVTRIVASLTEVSVFAANVITLLGLGMAIDYALFIVGRFREELAAGHPTAVAVERTLRTAGRTVAVSGLTVTLALSSLLLFPMGFLKSVAYGGMAAVLVAMLAALTSLPALLAVLGPRINALRIGRARRATAAGDGRRGAWERLALSVMRRPVIYLTVTAAVLVGLAVPFLRAEFGGFDERVLPEGTPSRVVSERLAADFPGGGTSPVVAVVDGATPEQVQQFTARVSALPGVDAAGVQLTDGRVSVVAVLYDGSVTSDVAKDVVRQVRDLPAPDGAEVLVGGRTAANLDQVSFLSARLPWMALYVFAVTFVLLVLAFGSVVLPVKAILMNVISIGASFGVIVWVFQDGHFADALAFTPLGALEPTNLVLLLAVLFGLSTDYEIFLLSRVREEYLLTGDNTGAVAAGLQRTGGIITAAALLLIVVVAGFATGGTQSIKVLGIGTVVAVAVDAALVRTLLVPATMRLLGRWNWWAPGPIARMYQRIGIKESEDLRAAPTGGDR
jgi:RND superfamily putative drug exporter